ncbi:hypothetical protein ACFQGX_15345 [Nonomuraea dietziae]|uniref:hypothetical protein n=1 Tax=Nonomuraea dietziae TaxID=65515 RepID=UPI0036228892
MPTTRTQVGREEGHSVVSTLLSASRAGAGDRRKAAQRGRGAEHPAVVRDDLEHVALARQHRDGVVHRRHGDLEGDVQRRVGRPGGGDVLRGQLEERPDQDRAHQEHGGGGAQGDERGSAAHRAEEPRVEAAEGCSLASHRPSGPRW